MGRSLLDDPRFEAIGRGKGGKRGGGGGSNVEKTKLFLAIGLFVAAGVLFAWYMELLPGTSSTPPGIQMTAEEQKTFDESVKKSKEDMKRPDIQLGGD